MRRPTFASAANRLTTRLVPFLLCIGLSACGGGADDSALASTGAANNSASGDSLLATSSVTFALPTVSAGFNVEIYSNVVEPMKLSFGSDGALYVGRHGGDRIHRVAPGGGSVSEFGPPMADPDAVLVDAAGLISGVPDSVLVGGEGVLAAIFQNQTATVVFNAGFADVDDMKSTMRDALFFPMTTPKS